MPRTPWDCPQCGGPAPPPQTEGAFACPNCNSRLRLASVARTEVMPPALAVGEAERALDRWLVEIEAAGPAEAVAAALVFFPFWLVEGRRLLPATAALVDGLDSVALPSGSRRPFDPEQAGEQGEVLEPGTPPGGESLPVLYLPFWDLEFAVRGRPARAWVSAVSGAVLPEAAPPSREGRLDAIHGAFLAGLLLALAAGFRLFHAGGAAAALGAALLVALGPLGVRWGRELVRRAEVR